MLNNAQLIYLNSSPKRSNIESNINLSSKRLKISNNNNNNTDSIDQKHFIDVLNMKSSHSDLYNQMTLNEIFERYKKKENIEEKLLQIMERDIKVIICRQCHYTSYKQSILCFRRTSLIRERHGTKIEDEILLLRGEEEKFLNSFVSYEKLPNIID
ncbi:unnamed protein product [Rotaria sp. Silwood1]|nr:unnamed protein product [Rotaria sp. Silwood1]